MKVERIALSKIKQVENSRGDVEKNIVPLMNSIQQHGLQEPIGVNFKDGVYTIVYGNRRFTACQKLGWNTIPAVLYTDMSDTGLLVNNLVENMQRESVSPSEIGRICEQLEKKGLNIAQMASRLDIPIVTIKTCISLYKTLPSATREKVFFHGRGMKKNGKVTVSGAKRMIVMREQFGLSKASLIKLFDYSKIHSLSNEEIKIVGLLMQEGKSFSKALSERNKYKVYRMDVVAIKEEIEQLARDINVTPPTYIAQVCYGLQSPITKPSFLEFKNSKFNRHLKSKIV